MDTADLLTPDEILQAISDLIHTIALAHPDCFAHRIRTSIRIQRLDITPDRIRSGAAPKRTQKVLIVFHDLDERAFMDAMNLLSGVLPMTDLLELLTHAFREVVLPRLWRHLAPYQQVIQGNMIVTFTRLSRGIGVTVQIETHEDMDIEPLIRDAQEFVAATLTRAYEVSRDAIQDALEQFIRQVQTSEGYSLPSSIGATSTT